MCWVSYLEAGSDLVLGRVLMTDTYSIDLETALRDLLECFEPTSPPMLIGRDGDVVIVNEQTEEAISNAERILGEEEGDRGYEDD
jgi:hypothetical protein